MTNSITIFTSLLTVKFCKKEQEIFLLLPSSILIHSLAVLMAIRKWPSYSINTNISIFLYNICSSMLYLTLESEHCRGFMSEALMLSCLIPPLQTTHTFLQLCFLPPHTFFSRKVVLLLSSSLTSQPSLILPWGLQGGWWESRGNQDCSSAPKDSPLPSLSTLLCGVLCFQFSPPSIKRDTSLEISRQKYKEQE